MTAAALASNSMSGAYRAPLALMRAALAQAARISGARAIAGYEETLTELLEPVLESAARFAGDVLSPLNGVGDRSPSRLVAQRGFGAVPRAYWRSASARAPAAGSSVACTKVWLACSRP